MHGIISRKNSRILTLLLIAAISISCNFIEFRWLTSDLDAQKKQPTEEQVKIIVVTATVSEPVITDTVAPALPTKIIAPSKTPNKVTKIPTMTWTSAPVIQQATRTVNPPTVTVNADGITVTAATGNLFIRRGPGLTYSITSGLSRGVTTRAVGRNEKNDWLAIEIPYTKGAIGWISMGTGYAELSANIQSLPLYRYDEAKPAYIKNCTLHDMTTRPGQWNLPAKTTQKVNPGEYAILDMSTGQSKVMDMVLKEGNTGIIKVDGDGISHSCP